MTDTSGATAVADQPERLPSDRPVAGGEVPSVPATASTAPGGGEMTETAAEAAVPAAPSGVQPSGRPPSGEPGGDHSSSGGDETSRRGRGRREPAGGGHAQVTPAVVDEPISAVSGTAAGEIPLAPPAHAPFGSEGPVSSDTVAGRPPARVDTVYARPASDPEVTAGNREVASTPSASTVTGVRVAGQGADAAAVDEPSPSRTTESGESGPVVSAETSQPTIAAAPAAETPTEPTPGTTPQARVTGEGAPAWSFRPAEGAAVPAAVVAQSVGDDPAVPAAAAETAPVQAVARINFGPLGRRRRPAVVVVLSVLTLGVYSLSWYARINQEMADFDPRLQVRTGRATWAMVIPWLLGILGAAAGAAAEVAVHLNGTAPLGLPTWVGWAMLASPLAIPYLVLLLPFSVVGAAMTVERIRVVEDHVGMTGDVQVRPAASIALLAVPVVGGLALVAREQRRLNDVWSLVAPSPRGRRR